jgi:protein SOK2
MINGTKLLNVAGMTRGRRDGILKAEKQKHVVKIGPMHLKGVWIPFEKALEFANKEKITEMLYPLFVHNIGALLYHPSNQAPGGQRGYGPMVGGVNREVQQPMNGGEWDRRESLQSLQSLQSPGSGHQGSPIDYKSDYANDQRLASEQLHQQQQAQAQAQQRVVFDHYPVQGS